MTDFYAADYRVGQTVRYTPTTKTPPELAGIKAGEHGQITRLAAHFSAAVATVKWASGLEYFMYPTEITPAGTEAAA